MRQIHLIATLAFVLAVPQNGAPQVANWKEVDSALGRTAVDQPDGTHRFAMPRSDLRVLVDGVELKAGFALGSWASFRMMGAHAEVMGDLVLTDTEVTPVMQKLIDSGFDITAVHNHLLNESPHITYMHIHGMGDPAHLALGLNDALRLSKTPATAPAAGTAPDLGIDTKQIDAAIGYAGKNNNGVYQFSIPRTETITEGGMTIPNSMGITTSINFQPTGGGKAAITGDFVLVAKEVNPVIKALRQNGISVTALHSHMLDEQPRLLFMHYWANDDAVKLAKGLQSALAQTNSSKQK